MSFPPLDSEGQQLLALGRALRAEGYAFVTPTPLTHARVLARQQSAQDLRDVFGWNRPFERGAFGEPWERLLSAAGQLVTQADGRLRSGIRFSTVHGGLFIHSGFPTEAADAVFLGPDTYRFVRVLESLPGRFERAIDVGAGSGAGLLSLHARCGRIALADLNPKALRFCATNAALNGVEAALHESDVLNGLEGTFDLIVSNPPYMMDEAHRTYRDGGSRGIELPARIVTESVPRLNPGGTLLLYTGTPIVAGRDLFREAVAETLTVAGHDVAYQELDPDVFGEELESPAYADVERIAVVALVVTRRS